MATADPPPDNPVGARARYRRPRLFIVLGLVVATIAIVSLLFASWSGPGGETERAQPGQRPRTAGPATDSERAGQPAPLTTARGLLLGTPIYDGDFADPYVLTIADTYYAYATNTEAANIPLLQIRRGNQGTYQGDVLPTLPAWSEEGNVWAPAVYATDTGYVLYYTTRVTSTGRQCLSLATSTSPLGPFVDSSTEPFVCQDDLGGTIDPSVVEDSEGRPWLLYKNDGNCCDKPTSLWSTRLSADGLRTEGEAHQLLTAASAWEGDLIEAPSMIVDRGIYYLFFSANAWDTSKYSVGYAVCEAVAGPCVRHDDDPWMTSSPVARGPGGQEFFSALNQVWMVYAAWERGQIGYPEGKRRLYLDIVQIDDGAPRRVGQHQAGLVVVALVGLGVATVSGGVLFVRRRRRRRTGDRIVGRDEETAPL